VNDVRTIMFTANFASLALPFPSSFATLTLQIKKDKKLVFHSKKQQNCVEFITQMMMKTRINHQYSR